MRFIKFFKHPHREFKVIKPKRGWFGHKQDKIGITNSLYDRTRSAGRGVKDYEAIIHHQVLYRMDQGRSHCLAHPEPAMHE